MKQILSVLMTLMLLGSIIPLSEATLVAAPGTIIGLLSVGQPQKAFTLDNGDVYNVALTFVNPTGNKYVNLNINGRDYNRLAEYQDRLRSDSVSGYDLGGNNEITIITIFPQDSQTPARVQFAIAAKQQVRSNAPYISNAQPRLAAQPTTMTVQARPVPTDTQAYPRIAMPSSGSPQPVIAQPVYTCESSCNEKYNACLQEQVADAAYSRFAERSPQQCESSYKNCLSTCKPQPTPPAEYPDCEARFKSCADYYGKDEQACKNVFYDCRSPCEERYNACAKYYGNEEDVCQKIISSCQKPVQSVCGNGACEKGEEWKTCQIDCQSPGSCAAFYNVEEQKTIIVNGQKFLLRYEGERGPLSEPVDSKTRWHEILVTVNNNLYSIDNINHKPTPLNEQGFLVMGYISDFDQYNQPRRADICIASSKLQVQQCGNQYCEKGEEWKTCPSDCKQPFIPPQPVPDCGSACKDSYSYCVNQGPFGVGQVWAEKLNDNSIRLGAKVVELTPIGSSGGPALNVDVIVSLDGREMKLAYDEKSGYYYSEQLREDLTGQHKLSARISKIGLGSVGVDHVIDFSGKLREWMAPPAVGMFPYASEGKVYTIEKPAADYQSTLEKQCSEIYNQCAQGCGYGSVPPASTCEDKCASIPCALPTVMPIQGSVKLSYGDTAPVVGNGFPEGEKALYVNFEDVDDSRCAPNLNCFTYGSATIRLYAHAGLSKEYNTANVLNIRIGDEAEPVKHVVNGETYVFTLAELVPVQSKKKEDYVAVINVEGPGNNIDCKVQYKQCLESCRGKPYPTIPPMIPPMPPAIVCDNSCFSESLSKCIPYGIRLVEKETPLYCGISGSLEKQKEVGATAQNNYECESNVASDGTCLDVQAQLSMLQKIWKLFSRILGGS